VPFGDCVVSTIDTCIGVELCVRPASIVTSPMPETDALLVVQTHR
jgi:hypothetical protein